MPIGDGFEQLFIDVVSTGVLVVAPEGYIAMANAAAEQIFALSRTDMRGTLMNSGRISPRCLDGTPIAQADRPFAVALRTQQPSPPIEMLIVNRDQVELAVRSWAEPIFEPGEADAIAFVVFIERLVTGPPETDLGQRVEQLESAFAMLAKQAEDRRTTVSGVSWSKLAELSGFAKLTGREREVLDHLAAGLRVANIADALDLSLDPPMDRG